jgi:cytochrome c biogenesis protein ResB
MSFPVATRLKRLLRSPWTITVELAGVALAGLASTFVDQHPTAAALAARAATRPAAAWVIRVLGLDRVFTSPWFLGLVAMAAGSLTIVVWEQWRRLAREWGSPAEASFRSAPYRADLVRPRTGQGRRLRIVTRGRIGTLGSPLFHTGLLLVALAGVGRMLVSADAAGEVMEGQVVPAGPEAFRVQDRGLLAAPVSLPVPVRLVEMVPSHYLSGDLLRLSARVALDPASVATVEVAVNAPLELGPTLLYLSQEFGPAAVLEIQRDGDAAFRTAFLRPGEAGDYEWAGPTPEGLELRLRAPMSPPGPRPPAVLEVRVISFGTLLAVGRLQPGSALELPGGGQVALRDMRWWVKLVASRDPTTWPVYLGFAVAIAGVVLMVTFMRTDLMVLVEPAGEGEERVVVAMRARRLAPIFAERFQRLVEEERGRG